MQRRSEQEVNKMLHSAKATLAIEGLQLRHKEEQLVKQTLMAKMNQGEFIKEALRLVRGGE